MLRALKDSVESRGSSARRKEFPAAKPEVNVLQDLTEVSEAGRSAGEADAGDVLRSSGPHGTQTLGDPPERQVREMYFGLQDLMALRRWEIRRRGRCGRCTWVSESKFVRTDSGEGGAGEAWQRQF